MNSGSLNCDLERRGGGEAMGIRSGGRCPEKGWEPLLYTQVEVRVNKRTALSGGPLDTAGGGGGAFSFTKKKFVQQMVQILKGLVSSHKGLCETGGI